MPKRSSSTDIKRRQQKQLRTHLRIIRLSLDAVNMKYEDTKNSISLQKKTDILKGLVNMYEGLRILHHGFNDQN